MKRIGHTGSLWSRFPITGKTYCEFDISMWFWIILLSAPPPKARLFSSINFVIAWLDRKLCYDNSEVSGISFKVSLPWSAFSDSRHLRYSLLFLNPPHSPILTSGNGPKRLFISTLRVCGTQFRILSLHSGNSHSVPTMGQAVGL